jgi:hypothetical protein
VTFKLPDVVYATPNKWDTWYTKSEMMLEPPPQAPDWVKPFWQPIPKNYPKGGPGTGLKSIECNPAEGAILFVGGPKHGYISAPLPTPSPTLKATTKFGEVVGTYVLEKQVWSGFGVFYFRVIYLFKESPPDFKMPSLPPPSYKPGGLLSNSGYGVSEKYPKISKKVEEEMLYEKELAYEKAMKQPYPMYTKGTHSGTMSFDFKATPEMLNTLYGKAAELDPWDTSDYPEETEEPALWEQI